MRKIGMLLCLLFAFSLSACENNTDYTKQIIGTWYEANSNIPTLTMYEDKTYILVGEYEYTEGTWSVEDGQLILSGNDGLLEQFYIINVEDDSMTLNIKNQNIQFWNVPYDTEDVQIAEKSDKDDSKQESGDDSLGVSEKISETSQVRIIDTFPDGTMLIVETIDDDQKYIVRANIYGDILGKMKYEFDGKYIQEGVGNSYFTVSDSSKGTLDVYDINTLEEVSNMYKGDYDEIISYIDTEQTGVFVVRKIVQSFEEEYACLKLVDLNGQELFNISLDSASLLEKYNIEKNIAASEVTIEYAGNNIFYIGYVGSAFEFQKLNSLVIDMNRNKVIPVEFPQHNGLYCSSDGDYTIVYSPYHGEIVVNQEAGTFVNSFNEDYDPVGKLSEGLIYAIGHWNGNSEERVFLNVQGNIVINLNDYAQKVENVWDFKNGIALLEFTNSYIAFINTNGDFLFEPVQGRLVKDYYENEGVALVYSVNEDDSYRYIAIDKGGVVKEVIPNGNDCKLIEYEGIKYWVSGGDLGLQIQKY